MKLLYTVLPSNRFTNLKELLKVQFEISDRLLLRLKRTGKILINSKIASINSEIHPNDKIEVILDFEEDNSNIPTTKMDLNILYEDDAYLVINKSADMPVHPSMDHYKDSLSNGVKYYFDTIRAP